MIRDTADIAIVGAGISGLTLALALARQGRPSVIYERTRVLSEAGAGIQLSPNASRILIDLGLERPLARRVSTPKSVTLFNGKSGEPLARVPLGDSAEERYGAPYWVIHRPDLQDVLLRAATASPDIIIKRGSPATQLILDMQNDRVSVALDTLSGTQTRNHDAVIGADGLWSTTRRSLGDHSRPRYSGYRAFRTVVPKDVISGKIADEIVGAWIANSGHVVHYPVISGFAVNLVAIIKDPDASEGWGTPAPAGRILSAFRGWSSEIQSALAASGDNWRSWALFDRPPRKTWSKGAATLIGDAAHPILPFLAQGGALGIEDAAALASEIVAHPGRAPDAFRQFERMRADRIRNVQIAATKNGRIFHMGWPMSNVRDLALQALPASLIKSRYDWLYGYRTP